VIAKDSLALAVRNCEITAEQAANGDLASALGFEPGQALTDGLAADAREPEQYQATPANPSNGPQLGDAPEAKPAMSTANQISLGGAGPGKIAPRAQQRYAAAPYEGQLSIGSSPAQGSAREAARAASSRKPTVTISGAAESA
jgi:hypothetical protein